MANSSNKAEPKTFPVILAGAGPGNPGLLTLRAREALLEADILFYDQLVSSSILNLVNKSTKKVCVDSLHPNHPQRSPLVIQGLIEAARSGLKVVRLKGGDPYLFGRGGEEAEALREAGLKFEIIPGVTAALGASSFAGIPLTHRNYSSAVALITGHEQPGKQESMLDWPALSRFPGTMVFYMGLNRLPEIVEALVNYGKSPETPSAAIHWASTNRQKTITSSLSQLPKAVREAGFATPTLVMIGDVVELGSHLNWFENRPLFGCRILVTRPEDQAGDMVKALEDLGAIVHLMPTVEILPPKDFQQMDEILSRLDDFDWITFTSVNGVNGFFNRLFQTGRDARVLSRLKIAAIGPSTAQALGSLHLVPDLVPDKFRSEFMVEAMREKVKGKKILLARADRGREVIADELAKVATVETVVVYRQSDVTLDPSRLEIINRDVDFITFTSSNIARSLFGQIQPDTKNAITAGKIKIVTISSLTSQAVREMGFPVAGEPVPGVQPIEGMIEVIVDLFQKMKES